MFAAWGRTLANHQNLVAILAVLSLVLSIAVMATVAPNLSAEGFVSETSESAQVDEILDDDFGRGGDSLVYLFNAGQSVTDASAQAAIESSLVSLQKDPRISSVLTTWSTGNPGMISKDGESTYVVALIGPNIDLDNPGIEAINHAVEERAAENGLAVSAGGGLNIGVEITTEIEEGLIRAESISIPITIVILLLVFGSAVAAGVPLLIAALAIVSSMAVIFAISSNVFQSVFSINIIIMLGLGLGIDYSLFMVTRFREEIKHRSRVNAVVVTMGTVGKAIFFSGITVIFGLAATQFFDMPALQSMGQAGMAVTALALIYGLTLLPALLAMIGPRINSLHIGRRSSQSNGESPMWHGIAGTVMQRPVVVLAAVLVLLLGAGIPLLRLDLTPGGPDVLPADTPARVVSERLAAEFPSDDAEPIPVLVTLNNTDVTSPEGVDALRSVSDRVASIDGVTRVSSFASDPLAQQAGLDWAGYTGDVESLPRAIQGVLDSTTSDNIVFVEVSTSYAGPRLEDLVRDLRSVQPTGGELTVGGFGAAGVDTVDAINDGIVPAATFVLVGSYLILLLTFGSVFLPIKAIFMTLLSISASLGAVVFIFQDGNFESLFGFQASGEIISTTPILIFCILFGLSMDYEVLMLSRIQEEYDRTGDNRASVAFGLSHTGKVITGAAAIMVVVFGGFMLADIVILKSMGFGLAFAVLIDATIVRGLLVPATMRLMGRWNWWAPTWVRRAVNRLGLSHSTVAVSPSES
jgi:RND superfamily putative drug exporter